MNRKLQYFILLFITAAVIILWAVNLIPGLRSAITFSLMLVSMLLMIVIHYYYLRSTPAQYVIEEPENNSPTLIQRQPVMLILGPFVEKWFAKGTGGASPRHSDGLVWIPIQSPQELKSTIANIRKQDAETPLLAFIPILTDVQENSSLLANSLLNWRDQYSTALASLALPAVIGIYSKMSYTYAANHRDSVVWTDIIDFNQLNVLNVDTALLQAVGKIQNKTEYSLTEIQQIAFIRLLIQWLNETHLKQTLALFLSSLNMNLDRILFCDDNEISSRHGALSYWLEQKLMLLPATSKIGANLKLPKVIKPKPIEIPPAPVKVSLAPIKYPAILWSIALTLMLLLTNYSMLFVSNKKQLNLVQTEIANITTSDNLSIQTVKRQEQKLTELKTQWMNCKTASSFANWGATPCQNIVQLIDGKLNQLAAIPYFSTQGAVSIYDSGSAKIKMEAKPLLDKMLALVQRYPSQNVQIVGYSDNTGNESINLSLSNLRAEGIRDWLISEGISSKRLKTIALGSREPIGNNDTPEGRQLNRRVEILILPPAK